MTEDGKKRDTKLSTILPLPYLATQSHRLLRECAILYLIYVDNYVLSIYVLCIIENHNSCVDEEK